MKKKILFDPCTRPVYSHLEPIIDLLLGQGNTLAHKYRWGENRTGFFCHLAKPIDFKLIEASFELPPWVRLTGERDAIECDKTWTTIQGCM
jgi:hypothetical protein